MRPPSSSRALRSVISCSLVCVRVCVCVCSKCKSSCEKRDRTSAATSDDDIASRGRRRRGSRSIDALDGPVFVSLSLSSVFLIPISTRIRDRIRDRLRDRIRVEFVSNSCRIRVDGLYAHTSSARVRSVGRPRRRRRRRRRSVALHTSHRLDASNERANARARERRRARVRSIEFVLHSRRH